MKTRREIKVIPMAPLVESLRKWVEDNPRPWTTTELYIKEFRRVMDSIKEQLGLTDAQVYNIALAFSPVCYDATLLSTKGEFDATDLAVGLNQMNIENAEAAFGPSPKIVFTPMEEA